MKIINNYFTVHKFGGSSLADADRFKAVKDILTAKQEVIVVSATKGTTSALQLSLDKAAAQANYLSDLAELEAKHLRLINKLIEDEVLVQSLSRLIVEDFEFIRNTLKTVSTIKSYSTEVQNFVLGFGEIWSAHILTAYLAKSSKALYLDASAVLYSYIENNLVCIDWQKTEVELHDFLNDKEFDQLVVTGFIAKTFDGKRTILGRNGSDYSGAIFAKLFKAKCLYIWTDVDGIYTAHPDKVKSAFVIEELSYKEAHELAYFGASVLYPMTVLPVESEKIPLYIKNSFNPTASGTYISQNITKTKYLIKGLTYISEIALINVEGAGLIGVAGMAARIFQVLAKNNISVILISQASSEHSICFVINNVSVSLTQKILQDELKLEIASELIGKINVDINCSVVSAVGDEMIGEIGVAAKICDTLANANVNIRAMTQGSSERNISVVINSVDINKALQALHAGFYLSSKSLSIGLIGPGQVGSSLLTQISNELNQLQTKYNINLCVRGIMGTRKMLLEHGSINLKTWQEDMQDKGQVANLQKFIDHVISDDVPHAVIVDCTASKELSDKYVDFLQMGINIVTPNKYANGGSSFAYYAQLRALTIENHCQYLYEATVCAGLPIIGTLADLVKTGDEITKIEGVLSGTLSYIFTELATGKKFSEVVSTAKKLAYTEPDPREDLSGRDVGRKLICLAREIGYEISLDEIKVVNLVPEQLRECSVDEFMLRITECDASMQKMVDEAHLAGLRLHYVASINEHGVLSVTIEACADNHPFNRLSGTDNMLIIHTKRYCKQPMIIQGPGAGVEVTATGVFADIIRLTASF